MTRSGLVSPLVSVRHSRHHSLSSKEDAVSYVQARCVHAHTVQPLRPGCGCRSPPSSTRDSQASGVVELSVGAGDIPTVASLRTMGTRNARATRARLSGEGLLWLVVVATHALRTLLLRHRAIPIPRRLTLLLPQSCVRLLLFQHTGTQRRCRITCCQPREACC